MKRPQVAYRAGQVWKCVGQSPSAFMIGDVRDKHYANGDVAERVYGVLITGVDGMHSHERDMDSRSLRKMMPILAFDPEYPAPESGQ